MNRAMADVAADVLNDQEWVSSGAMMQTPASSVASVCWILKTLADRGVDVSRLLAKISLIMNDGELSPSDSQELLDIIWGRT